MFTAALLTTARTRKQPKRPLTGKRRKVWNLYTHTCTAERCSAVKGGNNILYSNMDGPRDDHTERNKPDKDKYQVVSLTHRI